MVRDRDDSTRCDDRAGQGGGASGSLHGGRAASTALGLLEHLEELSLSLGDLRGVLDGSGQVDGSNGQVDGSDGQVDGSDRQVVTLDAVTQSVSYVVGLHQLAVSVDVAEAADSVTSCVLYNRFTCYN